MHDLCWDDLRNAVTGAEVDGFRTRIEEDRRHFPSVVAVDNAAEHSNSLACEAAAGRDPEVRARRGTHSQPKGHNLALLWLDGEWHDAADIESSVVCMCLAWHLCAFVYELYFQGARAAWRS